MTAYSGRCAWCGRPFASSKPRAHCSLSCEQRHAWFGVRPESNPTATRAPKENAR